MDKGGDEGERDKILSGEVPAWRPGPKNCTWGVCHRDRFASRKSSVMQLKTIVDINPCCTTHPWHHQRIRHLRQGDRGCSALLTPLGYNYGVPSYLLLFSHTVPVHLTAKSVLPNYSRHVSSYCWRIECPRNGKFACGKQWVGDFLRFFGWQANVLDGVRMALHQFCCCRPKKSPLSCYSPTHHAQIC